MFTDLLNHQRNKTNDDTQSTRTEKENKMSPPEPTGTSS